MHRDAHRLPRLHRDWALSWSVASLHGKLLVACPAAQGRVAEALEAYNIAIKSAPRLNPSHAAPPATPPLAPAAHIPVLNACAL